MSTQSLTVSGGCHCGAIAFEAQIDPKRVAICHCRDCQLLSGTAFRTVAFTLEDALTLKKGEPKIYVKTADSGRKRAQGFCGDCGSGIYATDVGAGPKVYGLRTGVLAECNELAPQLQIWRDSACAWLGEIESLPSKPGQP